ncbi:MAG: glycerol kinase GlpK [Chloroflexi bacterium]|nr:glycerol kinase GlpK [Chloroflexota bacterium]
MSDQFILAIDQGTTGTAALVFDRQGQVIAHADREIRQIYPRPGWVEHDPEELFQSAVQVAREALSAASLEARQLAALGISNQRETTLLWDRASGEPVANAVVWQCRRSAPICEELREGGFESEIRTRTGLVADAYFSGTKLRWLLDHVPGLQARAEAGEVLFGTVESWLIWRLSGGRTHVMDAANASRTMLFNLEEQRWDPVMLARLGVPAALLPEVRPNSERYTDTDPSVLGVPVPIAGAAGDQQAALFGQACFGRGSAKNTYGTGAFLLVNAGDRPPRSAHGLVSTVAWKLGDQVTFALEGSVFISGAAIQWLRDGLGIIRSADESEALALSVEDSGGVFFVPAFVGLGAPHWDMYARGAIVGLTGGSGRAHLVRAALESIAFQLRDVVTAMGADLGQAISCLRVDGGGSANRFLLQFQADQLGIPVERSSVAETTARGAAFLAGLAVGFWPDLETLQGMATPGERFTPRMDDPRRAELYSDWKRAVARASDWAHH